jgi:hypothetical protein
VDAAGIGRASTKPGLMIRRPSLGLITRSSRSRRLTSSREVRSSRLLQEVKEAVHDRELLNQRRNGLATLSRCSRQRDCGRG